MNVRTTSLPGLLLVEPRVFGDARGWFVETYQRDRYREHGIATTELVQDNMSLSVRGTLRGMHYRRHHPQGKLVCVTRGAVFDVAVDLRRGSPTFRAWFGTELSEGNHTQMWIPAGFAHGFLVLTDDAVVQYKVTSNYDADDERTFAWNDPEVGIAWPLDGEPLLSARDREAPLLRDMELPAE